MKTTAIIVDDHKMIATSLAGMLANQGMTILGTAANGKDGISMAMSLKPDLVLMDIEMEPMDGLTAAAAIKAFRGVQKVLMLTVHQKSAFIDEALRIGVEGYILKSDDPENLLLAIKTIMNGGIYFPPSVMAQSRVHKPNFTEKEIEVLRLMGKGYDIKRIASEIGISEKGVYTRIDGIKAKTGQDTYHGHISFAKEQGII